MIFVSLGLVLTQFSAAIFGQKQFSRLGVSGVGGGGGGNSGKGEAPTGF